MGLGLGLCCCGCATCGGIFDTPTSLNCNLVDIWPTTNDQSTHGVTAINWVGGLPYQASISTATVQVFSQTVNAGGAFPNFRATLRLEDGVAPVLSFVHNDTLGTYQTPVALSSAYVGSLGGKPGALFACGADGWTQTEYQNPTCFTRYYNLLSTDGACMPNVPGSTSPYIGTPDSWCCPNGNMSALGGPDGCVDRSTLPATSQLTVAGFSDNMPNWIWSQLNGVITLTKYFETAYTGPSVLGAYTSDAIVVDGCTYRWTALITAPDGTPSSQCGAMVSLDFSGTCTSAGKLFYTVGTTGTDWAWMQLGCAFGRLDNTWGDAALPGAPFPMGGPTSLTWAAP